MISIGNLSAGGSGKTPFVMLLGELLKSRGVKFDVLSRGYGRATRGVLLVDPAGLAQEFGDEPLLIARKLQVPVVAEDSFPLQEKSVWRVRRGIVAEGIPQHPVVFCGIARPQSFVLQLRAANIEPAAQAFYRDHHLYSESDVRELIELKQRSEAGGFVTTEKDAVNLGPYLSALTPLAVVPVRMELMDAANALDTMLRKIEERRRSA